jgi:prolyl oligopeptidase PreP (S9A serine peptidase family)
VPGQLQCRALHSESQEKMDQRLSACPKFSQVNEFSCSSGQHLSFGVNLNLMKNTSRFPIEDYFNRIAVFSNAALSPRGNKLAYISSSGGSPQVWVAELSAEGKVYYPKPVTSDKKKRPYVFGEALQWISEEQLICLFDTDGDEKTFIEILNFKTGETVALPMGAGAAKDSLGFYHDGLLYFSSNRNVPSAMGLFTFHLKTKKIESIYQNETRSSTWFSNLKIGTDFLFHLSLSNTSSTLLSVNLKSKKHKVVLDIPESNTIPIAVLPKNKLMVASDAHREFTTLAILDLKTKALQFLQKDAWDKEIDLSKNQKDLLVHENHAGKSILTAYAWSSAKRSMKKRNVKFPSHGLIDRLGFSKNGEYALVCYSSPTEPKDFYRIHVKSLRVQKLTDNYVSRIPQDTLVQPKLVKYASAERTIYSWLFLPKSAQKNRSLPVIVWPHGGPQSQERAQPRFIFQYFLSRGYAIWAPNHSGSTGFGKKCSISVERAWGTADLPDMENGIEWLIKSGWIDEKKMVIMGGSYGGYMTLRTITKLPHVFKVAVDFFGVSNLLTFVKSVPADWIPYMDRLVGNPERDSEMLKEQSPIFALDQIQCPLMVVQGSQDPRVVKAESDQVVAALKARNHPVEYVVFEDEGHGFFKLENELKAYRSAVDFIQKYL